MNNNEIKGDNLSKSSFINKKQANSQNINNENAQLNKNNKTKENFEVEQEDKEEEKSSCCLINIFNCVNKNLLESRQVSPFALTIFTIIGVLINLMVFVSSLIYSTIDFNPKTPYFYELMYNWDSAPIKDIDKDDITTSEPNTDWYDFKKWGTTNLKLSNIDTNYNLTLYNSVNKIGKICGKDSIGNDLYFDDSSDCPINDIYIDGSGSGKTDSYKNVQLSTGKYLHYTREKTDGTVYVQLLIKGEGAYCENQVFENHDDDVCYYMDNCYVNKSLYNITDCYQMGLYEKIDTCVYKDFVSDNELTEKGEFYKDDDQVTLNARGWIGIDGKYLKYLNKTMNYYEDIVVEYKWQLLMTIVSLAKTAFITLNNHFEWIKPWNLFLLIVNAIITIVIFSIEITQKSDVVKMVRAYYYLYNFIYDYLNKNIEKDYPPLEKKGFVRFYYNLLEIGYIVKLVAEICSWIDWLKFCDKCTCTCKNCDNRDCVKCKNSKCIINNVKCSCDCEKCKKNDCFMCDGASDSREIKNLFLKKRCDIFLKFFKNGWLGFKLITGILIVFIVFRVIFAYYIVKNDDMSFVD